MIRINTTQIEDIPLSVEGDEKPDVLEIGPNDPAQAEGPIHYNLTATMAGNDLLVTGKAFVKVRAECGKCLAEIHTKLEAVEICHLYEGAAGQIIDVTQDIREDLLLEMPFTFRCSPDCKGICPGCGANLNTEKCRCRRKRRDNSAKASPSGPSPWDALAELKLKK